MQMSSISILAAGTAVIAPLAVFLRYLLKQPFKVASTSQELLDLFEGALLEEHATLTPPNDEGRASEHLTVAPSNDLAPANASSTELSTSAEAYVVYRSQPARGEATISLLSVLVLARVAGPRPGGSREVDECMRK